MHGAPGQDATTSPPDPPEQDLGAGRETRTPEVEQCRRGTVIEVVELRAFEHDVSSQLVEVPTEELDVAPVEHPDERGSRAIFVAREYRDRRGC